MLPELNALLNTEVVTWNARDHDDDDDDVDGRF